jgi:hypothetical protein
VGWCSDFGPHIKEGCDHAMVAGKASCSCGVCGAVCTGRFDACASVWAAGPREVHLLASDNGRTGVNATLISGAESRGPRRGGAPAKRPRLRGGAPDDQTAGTPNGSTTNGSTTGGTTNGGTTNGGTEENGRPRNGRTADPESHPADPGPADRNYGTADPSPADPRHGTADPGYGTADPRYSSADPDDRSPLPRYRSTNGLAKGNGLANGNGGAGSDRGGDPGVYGAADLPAVSVPASGPVALNILLTELRIVQSRLDQMHRLCLAMANDEQTLKAIQMSEAVLTEFRVLPNRIALAMRSALQEQHRLIMDDVRSVVSEALSERRPPS